MKIKLWLLATRPKTLLASVCPVAIGSVLALRDTNFHGPAASAALAGALAIQIGTNFCNDYYDFHQGADTRRRLGPTRAVQAGWITPGEMLAGTLIMFVLAALFTAYLVWRAGWPLIVIGGLSILCGIAYTAGRRSLAYLGLADLFVLVFFGPVAVGGTYYVQALEITASAIIAGLAPGFVSTGLLVVNNLRDVEEDRSAAKRTLAVRFGKRFARCEYLACILAASMVPIVLWQMGTVSSWIWIATLPLLGGLWISHQLWRRDGRDLNAMLGATAGVLLAYTVTFTAGCLAG